jgi:hypothetical protein
MYKGNSASLQRAHGVHLIAPQKAALAEDYLDEPASMDLGALLDERGRLMQVIARVENEMSAARRLGRSRQAKEIATAKKPIEYRLGEVNDRIKLLRRIDRDRLWREAVAELCPDMADAVSARVRELQDEQAAGGRRADA